MQSHHNTALAVTKNLPSKQSKTLILKDQASKYRSSKNQIGGTI